MRPEHPNLKTIPVEPDSTDDEQREEPLDRIEPFVRFVEEFTEEVQPWDVDSLVKPGKITGFWGPANHYKTTLTYHLVLTGTTVAEGTWLGHPRLRIRRRWDRGAVWLTAEESGGELRSLRKALEAGAEHKFANKRIRVIDVRELPMTFDMGIKNVRWVLKRFEPDLIVFDNWGVLQPQRDARDPEFSPANDRAYLRELHKLLEAHQAAAVILFHPNKAGDAAGTYQLVMAGLDVRLKSEVKRRDIELGTARIHVEVEKVRGGSHVGKFVVSAVHGEESLRFNLEAEGGNDLPKDLKGKGRDVWRVLCGAAPAWLNTSEVAAKADCMRPTAKKHLDAFRASNWVEHRSGLNNADEWIAVEAWLQE